MSGAATGKGKRTARPRAGSENTLIEKIFDQLSSSVAIALLKNDKLSYEFYGGRKAAQSGAKAGAGPGGAATGKVGRGVKNGQNTAGANDSPGISRTTRFNIGSASAMFTGALAVKLMEFGELRLNDPARRFIPDFPFGDVTVYHLLTHTSGLASDNIPLPENQAARNEFYRKLFGGLKKAGDPGVSYGYFTYNHAVLAHIVEKTASQSLEELSSALLFAPLGMKYTTYDGTALKDNQYMIPWDHRENRFMNELRVKRPTGQNGAYTTALDMLRFGRMFINKGECDGRQVFLESSATFMLREITGGRFMRTPLFMIKRDGDAFGCFSDKLSGGSVAMTGDTGCILFIDPSRRVVGSALTNSTWVDAVSQNYRDIIDILITM